MKFIDKSEKRNFNPSPRPPKFLDLRDIPFAFQALQDLQHPTDIPLTLFHLRSIYNSQESFRPRKISSRNKPLMEELYQLVSWLQHHRI